MESFGNRITCTAVKKKIVRTFGQVDQKKIDEVWTNKGMSDFVNLLFLDVESGWLKILTGWPNYGTYWLHVSMRVAM